MYRMVMSLTDSVSKKKKKKKLLPLMKKAAIKGSSSSLLTFRQTTRDATFRILSRRVI